MSVLLPATARTWGWICVVEGALIVTGIILGIVLAVPNLVYLAGIIIGTVVGAWSVYQWDRRAEIEEWDRIHFAKAVEAWEMEVRNQQEYGQ